MTIKIIQQGTPPADIVYAGTCTLCKTQLECNEADGTKQYDQRDGCTWIDLVCPVCKGSMQAHPRKPLNSASIRGGLGT